MNLKENQNRKRSDYSKIGKYIFLNVILVPFIPFIIIMGTGSFYFLSSLANTSVSSLNRIVKDHRQMIESFLTERKTDLEFILSSYTFEELSSQERLKEIFLRLQAKSSAFSDLGLFDESGVHVAYQGGYSLSGKVYRDADWFRKVLKNGYYISDIFLGYRHKPHFILAVKKESGDRKYIIRATIDSNIFSSIVRKVRIGATGEAYILNRAGIFQTERRSGGSLMERDPDFSQYPPFDSSGEDPSFGNPIVSFIQKDGRGVAFQCAAIWMEGERWLLVVRQEKSDAFRTFRTAAYVCAIIALIGGCVIVISAFYITGRIVTRIKRADSERERLQEQLVMASRLAELGEMAAGFAHEINNPLQIIKNEVSLIDTSIEDLTAIHSNISDSGELGEIREGLNQISLQVNRCSNITHSVLKFGRKSEPQFQNLKLDSFIPEILHMVNKKASINDIEIELDIDEHTPTFFGDPSQLQQVFLNLFNNAFDAITDRWGKSGGKVKVSSRLNSSGRVAIRFSDNGSGISEGNMDKIFSPFFTTKPVGKGTGLGLSICYGLIKSMGGEMVVESTEGVGTAFEITFPISV